MNHLIGHKYCVQDLPHIYNKSYRLAKKVARVLSGMANQIKINVQSRNMNIKKCFILEGKFIIFDMFCEILY